MKNRSMNGLLKHFDFIALDFLCLQLCYFIGFWIRFGFVNPLFDETYLFEDIVLISAQLIFILFSDNYKNILKRKSNGTN